MVEQNDNSERTFVTNVDCEKVSVYEQKNNRPLENIDIIDDRKESENTDSLVLNYCRNKLGELSSRSHNKCTFELREDEQIKNFQFQVNKMKMWPSFDHIFKAARKDNKWFLKSIPLKGVNKILIKEQSLINISKVS
ncbi:hypothetical protein FG379_002144 [Cryptosporidium bovis]|uniref:uncharacterized protein n=1 Tax=Cryptosporidium bovis TaxID=310047 RepID=UPI00351A8CA6|nr:hypothetical protein FG379_002144 [Cryptosporidium bovis]